MCVLMGCSFSSITMVAGQLQNRQMRINRLYIIKNNKHPYPDLMQENNEFNFTEQPPAPVQDPEFKRQRQAYLAQRNAHKKEAQVQLKKNYGRSSSSDSDGGLERLPPAAIKANINIDVANTNSSKSSEGDSDFKKEREKYKAQIIARRNEMLRNKRIQFGSSSSDDQQMPVHSQLKAVTDSKIETTPRPRLYIEDQLESLSFTSLDLGRVKKSKPPAPLIVSVKLKPEISEKKGGRERFEVETPSNKGFNIWIEQCLEFKQNSLELNQRILPIYDMSKIKLLFIRTQSGCLKMKVNNREEEVFFAVDHKKINEACLDHYYYIFARIVTLKLQIMGKRPYPQQKGKASIGEQLLKGAQLTGKVRKSSFFGGWEEKIGVINGSGLSIYKQGKDKANLVIPYGTIKEIWTRFDFENDHLIVKFLHGSSKIELSIPVENYLARDNWLFHIYNLAAK